jgi:putative SOS response-associated peptidase YedK
MRPINARVETAFSKPLFSEAWKTSRCVIPADGWYEWKAERGKKQPYYFHRRDGQAIFFAGLWAAKTFCLFTTKADGDLAEIHERRPLSLRDEDARFWIEAVPPSPEKVVFCVVPPTEIAFYHVGPRVSITGNDGADLIKPIRPGAVLRQPDLL